MYIYIYIYTHIHTHSLSPPYIYIYIYIYMMDIVVANVLGNQNSEPRRSCSHFTFVLMFPSALGK